VQSSGLQVGANLSWVLSVGGKVGGALAVLVLLILLSLRHFAEPLRRFLLRAMRRLSAGRSARLEKTVNALFQGVESMRSDAALVVVLLYSVLEWLLICLCYVCLARAFVGIVNLGLVDVLILMGFV